MQKRLPEIMLQKTDDTVELREHDDDGDIEVNGDGEGDLEEDGGGDGKVDGEGEGEDLEEEEQGYEGTQPETEIEP